MKCSEIMNTNLDSLSESDTVLRAAAIMAESGVGFLPICDPAGKIVGVVTDRDIATRAVAKGVPPSTSILKIMSAPAITCRADADIKEAEQLMTEELKSRLVITSPELKLAGVLSIADLVENAPGRDALHTLKALLWREAVGPRGGALRGEPLLKDEPAPRGRPMAEADLPHTSESVFTGGHRSTSTKEFP